MLKLLLFNVCIKKYQSGAIWIDYVSLINKIEEINSSEFNTRLDSVGRIYYRTNRRVFSIGNNFKSKNLMNENPKCVRERERNVRKNTKIYSNDKSELSVSLWLTINNIILMVQGEE